MKNVATIHGGRVPGQPSEAIIETLESLLVEARSGRLIGVAYATCCDDGKQGTGWDGEAGSRHPLGTAIMMLHHRYADSLLNGGNPE